MRLAENWVNNGESAICTLCERCCCIPRGGFGYCDAYQNINDKLYSRNYGMLCGMNIEPLSKQPITFHPTLSGDSKTLVIGSFGCNLRCKFCINADQSQIAGRPIGGMSLPIEDIINSAVENGCESITYAYTEPTVYYEFVLDVARRVKETTDLKNVVITNGFMAIDPLRKLAKYIDGVNIDYKGSREFYKQVCDINNVPIKNMYWWSQQFKVHTEITTLVIPQVNSDHDTFLDIARDIYHIDKRIPWHLTKFYPAYKMKDIQITTNDELDLGRSIGEEVGLENIKVWN